MRRQRCSQLGHSLVMAVDERSCLRALLALLAVLAGTQACSPVAGVQPTPLEQLRESPGVLYGLIVGTYPDERFNYGQPTTVYTATMRVYCVLKGPRTASVVNITEAGYVPAHCTANDLLIGGVYLLPVSTNTVGVLTPYSVPLADEQLPLVMDDCSLDPRYPIGIDEATASTQCPVITAKNCGGVKRCFGEKCRPVTQPVYSSAHPSAVSCQRSIYIVLLGATLALANLGVWSSVIDL